MFEASEPDLWCQEFLDDFWTYDWWEETKKLSDCPICEGYKCPKCGYEHKGMKGDNL